MKYQLLFLAILCNIHACEKPQLWESANYKYTKDGITIYSVDDYAFSEFAENLPRDENTMKSKGALKIADQYLTNVFGKSFKPEVVAVCLHRSHSAKNKTAYWYWQISYKDPKFSNVLTGFPLIIVCISSSGEVMMKTNQSRK
jgi:hypothetical protein